jgi:hypothetical protein
LAAAKHRISKLVRHLKEAESNLKLVAKSLSQREIRGDTKLKNGKLEVQ